MDQKHESHETKMSEMPPSASVQQATYSTGQGINQYLVTKYWSVSDSALHEK